VTKRTQGGGHATGLGARAESCRVGWERLLADVLGRGGPGRARLYAALAEPDDLDAPWTRQELDALWAAVHAQGRPVPADDYQAVG
jgi:hypothetical protein